MESEVIEPILFNIVSGLMGKCNGVRGHTEISSLIWCQG